MKTRNWLGPVAALVLATGGIAAADRAGGSGTKKLELWQDPSFQKQFVGSYGFQAEIEPGVTAVERQLLEEEILPVMDGDPEAAIAALKEHVTPGSSAVFDFTLGNLYFQKEDLDEAAARYEAALAKFPSFRRAYKNLGLIRVRQGDLAAAIPALSKVIELGGADGLTYGLLGYAYAATEQYLAAESAYRNAMLLQADVNDWRLGLTQSVLHQRRFAEAATLCDELIQKEPDRGDLWLLQANAFIGMKEPMQAAENYEFVDRMGQSTDASLRTLGDIYVNEGLWDLAARAYGKAFDLDPAQSLRGPLHWVEILAQRGALEQAGGLLARIQAGHDDPAPEDRKTLLKLEARLAVAGGEGGEAVSVLEEIVALDPLDGEALLLLGEHYARADEPEKAVFYYERAESLEEYEADARVRHAQVLVAQSRYDEAVPLLKRSQELEPREEIARYLEQVERVARQGR